MRCCGCGLGRYDALDQLEKRVYVGIEIREMVVNHLLHRRHTFDPSLGRRSDRVASCYVRQNLGDILANHRHKGHVEVLRIDADD